MLVSSLPSRIYELSSRATIAKYSSHGTNCCELTKSLTLLRRGGEACLEW